MSGALCLFSLSARQEKRSTAPRAEFGVSMDRSDGLSPCACSARVSPSSDEAGRRGLQEAMGTRAARWLWAGTLWIKTVCGTVGQARCGPTHSAICPLRARALCSFDLCPCAFQVLRVRTQNSSLLAAGNTHTAAGCFCLKKGACEPAVPGASGLAASHACGKLHAAAASKAAQLRVGHESVLFCQLILRTGKG